MSVWPSQHPFNHLPESARKELGRIGEAVRLAKGTVLFREGEGPEFLWVLLKGWVRLTKRTANGKGLTLDLVTPKDRLLGLSAFSDKNYLATAVAATPVEAIRLPADRLQEFLRSYASFAVCVTGIFSQRFHNMAEFYATAFAPVEQRIAAVLLRLDKDFGSTLPVTRREIAEMTGTTVETAIRVTNRMRKENLLLMKRGQIVLVNPKALAQKIQKV